MLVVTAAEMRQIDNRAIEEMGMPGLILMENAGRAVAFETLEMAPSGPVLVLAGMGNNGGDGFVAARHLACDGVEVEVCLAGTAGEVRGDARTNLEVYRNMGLPLREIKEAGEARASIERASLIIDALLGTGFTGTPRQPLPGIIDLVNSSGKPVLAVDIPSGVDADTGRVARGIKAAVTVTLALPKRGLFLYPGAELSGDIVVADISIPPGAVKAQSIPVELVTEASVKPFFLSRPGDAHKGDFGHVLVVAGSQGLAGAAILTTLGALRTGAGLATVAVPECIQQAIISPVKEAMTRGLPCDSEGRFLPGALDGLSDLLDRVDVVALGPGLGQGEGLRSLVAGMVSRCPVPMVIDADGLNNLAGAGFSRGDAVLTPHPGEMSRLTGASVEAIQADRIGFAGELARQTSATVLLKGAPTVVSSGGLSYLNILGNPGMATGGSGDVLTGVIAGLMAQGLSPEDAARAGAFLHGAAGDEALNERGQRGLIAGDLVEYLPGVIAGLEGMK